MDSMFFLLLLLPAFASAQWNVGVGIADTTGPAAEVGMMGYAKAGQNTGGIHIRLYSRAYIFEDADGERAVFVSVDSGMMGQLVKQYVIESLENDHDLGDFYSQDNVILSGTHTHSGPGGYVQYVLIEVTTLGFVDQSFFALVDGITQSIVNAHENMQPARLFFETSTLTNANINRSPTSYEANPQEERDRYGADTDHQFPQLTILNADTSEPMGIINWFSVHPVSMNNTNHLISGDNKGVASQIVERSVNVGQQTGKGPFVAAFASTNLGDVSPNLEGPICQDTGEPCDPVHSTCGDGTVALCWASGPGEDMFESTWIIGERQAEVAMELLDSAESSGREITGNVNYIKQWVNMRDKDVTLEDGSTGKTCPPALGYGFAAGTTDGPGAFNFIQGTNQSNPFWDFVAGLIQEPSPEQEACHAPKPVLLDTGEITEPYLWHPDIVDTQVVSLGDLYIVAAPGEFTTMSGRRMRDTVKNAAIDAGAEDTTEVVIAGLCNVYTHYIATFEEYQRQRYEAASTLYGPHTLAFYQQQYDMLTRSMINGDTVVDDDTPPDFYDIQLSFLPDPDQDVAPQGKMFGEVIEEPAESALAGESVIVSFVGGNLRNDLLTEDSFLFVEMETGSDTWEVVYTDSDWETKLYWTGDGEGGSVIDVVWDIPEDQLTGNYRITHQGYETSSGSAKLYSGMSRTISVEGVEGDTNNTTTDAANSMWLSAPLVILGAITIQFCWSKLF